MWRWGGLGWERLGIFFFRNIVLGIDLWKFALGLLTASFADQKSSIEIPEGWKGVTDLAEVPWAEIALLRLKPLCARVVCTHQNRLL